MRVAQSILKAFSAEGWNSFVSKLTKKSVLFPLVYSLITIIIFAIVYAAIGYNEHFETNDNNKDKNIENSITASVMLQSNSMGNVTAKTSLGNWLMTSQVAIGWLWYLCIVNVFFA